MSELATVSSSRLPLEIHNVLLQSTAAKQQTRFSHGVATVLLWQLGRVPAPSEAARDPSTGFPVPLFSVMADDFDPCGIQMGAVARGLRVWVHPTALKDEPKTLSWLRGIVAGYGWLLGLCETAQLESWLADEPACLLAWANLGPLEDPWSPPVASGSRP